MTDGQAGPSESAQLPQDSPYWLPLNAGWRRELVYRSTLGPNNKKADAYYKAPASAGGKKYRSLRELERAIQEGKPGFEGLDVKNFTYHQTPLNVNDSTKEVIRGADPSRMAFGKRTSEAGEQDSPTAKKTKTSPPKPKPSQPKLQPPDVPTSSRVTSGSIKIGPMPTVVGTPVAPYRQTAVRTPVRAIRPYQQTMAGPRAPGAPTVLRPVPTSLLMNPKLPRMPQKTFTTPVVPPSPEKSAEEIVCEPAIYEGDELDPSAEVVMDTEVGDEEPEQERQTYGDGSVQIETNDSDITENGISNGLPEDGQVTLENVGGELSNENEHEDSEQGLGGPSQQNMNNHEESEQQNDRHSQEPGQEHDRSSSEPDSTTQCLCGMCVVPVTEEKIICCSAVDDLFQLKVHGCITFHPSFEKLILDKDVLSLTRHLLSVKTKNASKKNLLNAKEPLNITWRYIAYKQFISWVNQCLQVGMNKRIAIPSCVVQAVRVRFPEKNCNYRVLRFT